VNNLFISTYIPRRDLIYNFFLITHIPPHLLYRVSVKWGRSQECEHERSQGKQKSLSNKQLSARLATLIAVRISSRACIRPSFNN